DNFVPLMLGGKPDVTPVLGVLGSIIEQVGEDLGEADRVCVQMDRLRRQCDGQLMAVGVDEGAGRFDGAPHDYRQFNPLLAQLQFSSSNAGDVEQVVNQSDYLSKLTLYDAASFPHERSVPVRLPQ